MFLFCLAAIARLVLIERGANGFGVVCNSRNVIKQVAPPADAVLHVGDTVVAIDGERLNDGERLVDRIRAAPEKKSFTLELAENKPPQVQQPPLSLNDIMKNMISSPGFKKMATKMVVGMTQGAEGGNLLEGGAPQARLASGPAAEKQLAMERQVEAQVGAMLESPAFGNLLEKVVESPGVQRIVEKAEKGTLCPEADGPAAMAACLLGDGKLLKSVTDATCDAAGLDKAACREVHASTEAMLGRLGLSGDGWLGWFVRRFMLQPWSTAALLLLGAASGAAVLLLLRLLLRRLSARITAWRGGDGPRRRLEEDKED